MKAACEPSVPQERRNGNHPGQDCALGQGPGGRSDDSFCGAPVHSSGAGGTCFPLPLSRISLDLKALAYSQFQMFAAFRWWHCQRPHTTQGWRLWGKTILVWEKPWRKQERLFPDKTSALAGAGLTQGSPSQGRDKRERVKSCLQAGEQKHHCTHLARCAHLITLFNRIPSH